MTTVDTDSSAGLPKIRGVEWLFSRRTAPEILVPETLNDDHRLVARTVSDFVSNEVVPATAALEAKDWTRARQLFRRSGELGLLGVDVPERDGGVHVDTVTSMLVTERLAVAPSFGTAFGAQLNLVVLALSLFGTEDQKRRYLPGLLSGETVGAYCLSEPGSGSDALAARTRADRDGDSFVLNGEKAWITNGGIADLFVIFAKVDGTQFTAFLVERAFPGITTGKEEHKMGLHGSSTTPVVLEAVRVPVANVLGEIGKGHKLAFNVLNFARFKLGATSVGAAVGAIGESARYGAERRQFGQPIGAFGAIKHKLGEMVVRTYAAESLNYRIAGLVDAYVADAEGRVGQPSATIAALEEFAVEMSIAKVAGSEMLDFVLDENIQVHGGNGYVRDYPAERHYRDSRVNRIFEGTNEINRLLIPGIIARRVAAGRFTIAAASQTAIDPRRSSSGGQATSPQPSIVDAQAVVERLRDASRHVLSVAIEACGQRLNDEQEVAMYVADMLIDLFASDSAVQRAARASSTSGEAALHLDAARTFVNDAAARVVTSGRQALAAVAEIAPGMDLSPAVTALTFNSPVVNTVALRRRLADDTLRRGAYPFR